MEPPDWSSLCDLASGGGAGPKDTLLSLPSLQPTSLHRAWRCNRYLGSIFWMQVFEFTQRLHFADKGSESQSYYFSSSYVWM